MRIKAILFDIDGTLVDSNALHVAAWEQAFREAGHAVAPDAIAGQIGKGADMLVPALLPGADAPTAERLGDRHGAIFKARYLAQVKPFPHARELVVRAHASGRKVVLASSASREELDHYQDLLRIRPYVTAGTSIDDVGRSKPAPDIFAVALEKAGVAADATLAVGDAPYDVAAAGKAGIAAVALRSGGYSDDALKDAVAIYDDAAALLAEFDASPLAR